MISWCFSKRYTCHERYEATGLSKFIKIWQLGRLLLPTSFQLWSWSMKDCTSKISKLEGGWMEKMHDLSQLAISTVAMKRTSLRAIQNLYAEGVLLQRFSFQHLCCCLVKAWKTVTYCNFNPTFLGRMHIKQQKQKHQQPQKQHKSQIQK